MSRSRKFVVVTASILAFTILTSGQTAQPVQLVVDPVIQKDAPVQIVALKENGDNALATVIIKNTTDKYVQKTESPLALPLFHWMPAILTGFFDAPALDRTLSLIHAC